jgi:hypothetical protein
MTNVRRLISSVLFALGVLMVFIGLSAALQFTPWGMFASVIVIGALLYAGAIWFATPSAQASPKRLPHSVIVFDRNRQIVAGPSVGQALAQQFPEAVRADIEHRCASALSGASFRFSCAHDGKVVTFDALPVRTADGLVIYGILIAADVLPATIAATA